MIELICYTVSTNLSVFAILEDVGNVADSARVIQQYSPHGLSSWYLDWRLTLLFVVIGSNEQGGAFCISIAKKK